MKKLGLIALFGIALMTQVYAAAPAAKILLKQNQQMVDITLAANATTGYQWFVQNYDHDLLSLQNYRYVKNANSTGKVGVGGTAIFSFAVDPRFYDAPQTTLVSFVYQQPWNPGQNASVVQVAISATASSNDLTSWQKYPQLAGPAAEVQASETEIYAEAQGNAKPVTAPAPMVTLPGATTPAASAGAASANSVKVPAANSPVSTTSAPVTASSAATPPQSVANDSSMTTPVAASASQTDSTNNQVMPAGTPTPDTTSQSQWLSLPANAASTPSSSGAPAASTSATNNSSTITNTSNK